jgi:hypothetical protein
MMCVIQVEEEVNKVSIAASLKTNQLQIKQRKDGSVIENKVGERVLGKRMLNIFRLKTMSSSESILQYTAGSVSSIAARIFHHCQSV